MATSDERLKVAASLRDEAAGFRRIEKEYGHEPTIDLGDSSAVLQDVAHFVGLDGIVRTYALFDRLAYLIDQTCHAVHSDTAADNELACSECGTLVGVEMTDGKRLLPRYCECCGARIMDGGEG